MVHEENILHTGTPNEEHLRKFLNWRCAVFPYHFSAYKGNYVKAKKRFSNSKLKLRYRAI